MLPMKMNEFNFSFSVATLLVITILMMSCEKNDLDNCNTIQENLFSQLYVDSAYLEIEGNLYDPEIIWGNVDVYLSAFERMQSHLKFKDNHLYWDFERASDIKVSENIYNYVIDNWKSKNEMINAGTHKLMCSERGDYNVIPILDEKLSRASSPELPVFREVLWFGQHRDNMIKLSRIWSYYGPDRKVDYTNLNKVIDIPNSGFHGDGAGDVSIRGEGTTAKGGYWGYYCCNACAFNKADKYGCYFNEMAGWNHREELNTFYEIIQNVSILPLITLRNRRIFEVYGY